eukprot:scaffold2562_cov354-Prasinococcus_capsulatus_cf.AAC.7
MAYKQWTALTTTREGHSRDRAVRSVGCRTTPRHPRRCGISPVLPLSESAASHSHSRRSRRGPNIVRAGGRAVGRGTCADADHWLSIVSDTIRSAAGGAYPTLIDAPCAPSRHRRHARLRGLAPIPQVGCVRAVRSRTATACLAQVQRKEAKKTCHRKKKEPRVTPAPRAPRAAEHPIPTDGENRWAGVGGGGAGTAQGLLLLGLCWLANAAPPAPPRHEAPQLWRARGGAAPSPVGGMRRGWGRRGASGRHEPWEERTPRLNRL